MAKIAGDIINGRTLNHKNLDELFSNAALGWEGIRYYKETENSVQFFLGNSISFLKEDFILQRLGISKDTLASLATDNEFITIPIENSILIDPNSLYNFLDKVHYMKRRNLNIPAAIDPKGNIKENLTYVNKSHTSVPILRPIKDFAEDLGLKYRTFLKHCEIGDFTHYRIGSLYKMTEEDYTKDLMHIAQSGMKSNRGKSGKSNYQNRYPY